MEDCTWAMVFSTAGLLNLRFASGVRTTGNPFSAAANKGVRARVEAAREVLRMNSRRFIFVIIQSMRNLRLKEI